MKWSDYFNQVLRPENQLLWLMLAMHAGYLNAGGFLACHRFVSHMTGFGTQIGVSFGLKEYAVAFEMLLAPVCFILGSATAGYMMDRKLVNNERPRVLRGMLWIVILDAIVWLGGIYGVFGEFGEPLVHQRDFILLFLLTFNCGLQNGLFVTVTSGQVRTTHITGLSTDIGLNAVKALSMKGPSQAKVELVSKNFLRLKTLISFSVGSLVSALIFQRAGYWGFLVSFCFALVILIYLRYLTKRLVHINP